MPQPEENSNPANKLPSLDRRALLTSALAAGLASTGGAFAEQVTAADQSAAEKIKSQVTNPITFENSLPGTTDWQLTYTKVDPATKYRSPWIEGYVSQASIAAGETLEIFVSTRPAAEFSLDIYRLGYYGGTGGRLVQSLGKFAGQEQPDPPTEEHRLRQCQWKASTSVKIPATWTSGVYVGKLSLVGGRYQSYVIFIVKDDRPSEIAFQCSDNTWQAYNRWPSQFSLYDNGASEWALVPNVKVSYDRPYGKYCQILDAPLSQGSGEFLLWEFPFVYWLEQHGYDVKYVSNTDVHTSPKCLTNSRTMLSVGHDEYWSLEQFANVQQAVNEGVSVGFFSGNTCCFVTPLTPSSVTQKPARVLERAGRYGGLLKEEVGHMGPFSIEGPNERMLLGCRTVSPFNGSGDWTCVKPNHWLFAETGMKNGEGIPGLVGWEFHGDPAPIVGLEVVAEGETINAGEQHAHFTATIYPGPKGNWVFNAATIFWAQGLSVPPGHIPAYSHYGRPHGPDRRVQQITANFLEKCLGRQQG